VILQRRKGEEEEEEGQSSEFWRCGYGIGQTYLGKGGRMRKRCVGARERRLFVNQSHLPEEAEP